MNNNLTELVYILDIRTRADDLQSLASQMGKAVYDIKIGDIIDVKENVIRADSMTGRLKNLIYCQQVFYTAAQKQEVKND